MIDSILKKCRILKLSGIVENLEEALEIMEQKNWSCPKTLDYLFGLEEEKRWKNRIARRYQESKLEEKITIDQFDFQHHNSRNNLKSQILRLIEPEFIQKYKDVILIGNTGTGKTFLGKCIGFAATQSGFKVVYTTAMDMLNQLIAAESNQTLVKKLHYYQSPDLLICDELGYFPLERQSSSLFFQVINARHKKKSTVITTNHPFSAWGKIFEDTVVATTIADRLVFNSEVLILEGSSYRLKKHKSNQTKSE